MAEVSKLQKKLVINFKNAVGKTVNLSLIAPDGTGYTANFLQEDDRLQDAVEAIIASGCFGKYIDSTDEQELMDNLVTELVNAEIVTTDTTTYDFSEE